MNKRFLSGMLVCGTLLAGTGCSHDFLDLEPQNGFTAENFWKTERQITQAVNGGYTTMRGIVTGPLWRLGEYRSDNTTFTENPTDRGQAGIWGDDLFVTGSSVAGASDMWSSCYNGISRTNLVLDNIETADFGTPAGPDEALRTQRRAEARFFRAFFYWMLVRNFGDVPVVLKTDFDEASLITKDRRPVDEVYADALIPDVEYAIANLPVSYPSTEIGRVTKGAARMLLAHAYFTRRNFAAAIPVLDSVIGGGQYQLSPNYADVFSPDNTRNREIILAAQFDASVGQAANYFLNWLPQNSGTALTGSANITASAGQNRPTRDLYQAYGPDDPRRDISIGVYLRGRDTFLYPKKLIPPPPISGNAQSGDFPVFRYADALLMRAEALVETSAGGGLPDQAFLDVNAVRGRVGLGLAFPGNPDPELDLQTADALRQFIRNERRLELALENYRWYDLVRYGTVQEVMRTHGESLKTYQPYARTFPNAFTNIPELFPLPLSQVQTYGYPQNPGY